MKKNIFKTTRKQIATFVQEVNQMSNNGQVYQLAKKWETDIITHLPTIEIEVKGTHVTRPFIDHLRSRIPAIEFEAVCMDVDKLYVILSLRREDN